MSTKKRTYNYDPTIINSGVAAPGDTWSRKVIALLSYDPTNDMDFQLDLEAFQQHLSPRQKTILDLTLEGYSQREIGFDLNVGQSTVSRELNRIAIAWERFHSIDGDLPDVDHNH